jgi:hypothetical protein
MLLQSNMSWAQEDGSMHCISILAQPSQQGPTPPEEVEDAAGPELLALLLLLLAATVTVPAPLELAVTVGPLAPPPPVPAG